MTTSYEFCVGYTKLGVATVPSVAPTITVVDSANNILVAALTAVTALTNLTGAYRYSYSGADGLICYGLFHTTDATMDQQDLFSYGTYNISGGNGGALSLVYTVNASGGGVLEGATVKLYSDSGRTTLVNTKITNVLGQVTFTNLVAGTYYLTTTKSGYSDMTDTEVVS